MLTRLHEAVAAVCPIDGVSGDEANVEVYFRDEATEEQRSASQIVVKSFDYSQKAQDDWVAAKQRDMAKEAMDSHTAVVNRALFVWGLEKARDIQSQIIDLVSYLNEQDLLKNRERLAVILKTITAKTDEEWAALKVRISSGEMDKI